MKEEQSIEQLHAAKEQEIFDRIKVTRTMIHKGKICPKGFIYYAVKYKTFKDEVFEGVRLIDKEKEDALGMATIVTNIKKIIAVSKFNFSYDLEIEAV